MRLPVIGPRFKAPRLRLPFPVAHFRRQYVTSGCQYAAQCGAGKQSRCKDVNRETCSDLEPLPEQDRAKSQRPRDPHSDVRGHSVRLPPKQAAIFSEDVAGLAAALGRAAALRCGTTLRTPGSHRGEGVRQTVCERTV